MLRCERQILYATNHLKRSQYGSRHVVLRPNNIGDDLMNMITYPDQLQKVIEDIETLAETSRRQQKRYESLDAQDHGIYADPSTQVQTPINDVIEDRKKDADRWKKNAHILRDILSSAY